MAAEIKPTNKSGNGNVRKPVLVSKIEGHQDDVNMACIIPREEGVISVSDDKTVRVWLRRDTGQYWPSICHTMPAAASSMLFNGETRRLFIGLDNGTISEFTVSDDFNRMSLTRDYLAHQSRVTSMQFSLQREWLLSCGRDKYFQWHCSETGRRLGGYQASAWCLCLEFDEQSNYVFVGDLSGQISVLKINNQTFNLITTLKGHSGSVRSLAWDVSRSLLFSGSYDQSVIVWDIGGRQGTAFELQGHRDRVQALVYSTASKQLISTADDKIIGIWDMATKRIETPEWAENDHCQKCEKPFFWNFRKMWQEKTIGIRQHHCRKCGKAVCEKCSNMKSTIPPMGYEYDVRVCDDCYEKITDEERAPLATFHDAKHAAVYMYLEETRKRLITVGKDRVIKIWDLTSVLH
ncbi:WD repeat and FYVE domain-containing protein 2-like [Ruditapes philippinarum]|uniref:WD repeat and FYVE domain-containing protein 2-like n=1 Tax=Ruditapes philippinarum TaxID=129788 RepID=UPI00295A9425|nr:WD repeat and FYVE domain-containing protein 2-like [Ruditapes philippinarum]